MPGGMWIVCDFLSTTWFFVSHKGVATSHEFDLSFQVKLRGSIVGWRPDSGASLSGLWPRPDMAMLGPDRQLGLGAL